jgi:indole-3-acetate monooxygenase
MTILERDLDGALAVVAEHAAAQAEARRLDDEVAAAVAATGLHRSLVPAELGGDERHPNDVVEDVAQVAAVDGSTGWCTAIGLGSNLFAGYVPEAVARRDFADLGDGGAGMFAPAGVVKVDADGRATLSGRWPFTSNCVHGRWIGLGAFVERADGSTEPIPRLVILPHDDVKIEDTWFGDGLRATGSHHVRTDGVTIDLDRSCTFADRSWAAGPLWRMPMFTVLAPVLCAALLGVARGAVDGLMARVVPGEGGAMRGALQDDPVGLAELGAADMALRAAHAGMRAVVEEVWQEALTGERSGGVLQARVALAVQHAADVAVESTSVAHRLWGGAAAYLGNRALDALRDVQAGRQHVLFAHQHRPALVRIAAGSPELAPPFVL